MRFVTFQSIEALKYLVNKGYLETDERYVDVDKAGIVYDWIIEEMNKRVSNKYNTKYPLWGWVKYKDKSCPPKHRGDKVIGFDVKIVVNKEKDDIFITDYVRYSFVLNNMYIPRSIKDKDEFLKVLEDRKISLDDLKAYVRKDKYGSCRSDEEYLKIVDVIRERFSDCITDKGDILQGCVWRIEMDEVERIEILPNDGYTYGTLNYVRNNGKRKNWIEEYYKTLK